MNAPTGAGILLFCRLLIQEVLEFAQALQRS